MGISTKDQATVKNIFMTALKDHFPEPVSFHKVEVSIGYDQDELPHFKIDARYLADDPELAPMLMATLHRRTTGRSRHHRIHGHHVRPTTRIGPAKPMIDPEALIATARRLLTKPGQQAAHSPEDLRRAVSTAYYALARAIAITLRRHH